MPEPTPPQTEFSSDDYPEPPEEPTPPQEPTPPSNESQDEIDGLDQHRQEGTPDKDKTLAELISDQLRHIDGTTGLTHGEIAKLANQIADLAKPSPTGGDPLQPIMEQVLDMLTKLGERMTVLDRRMSAMEKRQHTSELWQVRQNWFMTGLVDVLEVKPTKPAPVDYSKGSIDYSEVEPPLPSPDE